MRNQLERLGLDYEFFDAIDASRRQLVGISRYDETRALSVLGHALQPGEVGCFASHYLLWKRCSESGEPMIIMEDDVELEPQFAKLPALIGDLLRRCGFIRLAGLAPRDSQPVADLSSSYRLVRFLKGPRGTQCYALHPQGARALLQHAQVWIDAVDVYVDAFWLHGVASYAVLPFRVHHAQPDEVASLIGDTRWSRSRTMPERLRRNLTHMAWSWRRQFFNFRYWLRAQRQDEAVQMRGQRQHGGHQQSHGRA